MRLPVIALAVLAGAACDPRVYGGANTRPAARAEGEQPPAEREAPPPVNPLGALAMMSRPPEPGPFDEPLRSAAAREGVAHAAVLELRGRVVELDAPFTFSLASLGGGESVALRALVARLTRLDGDRDVAVIVLRLGDLELSMTSAEELRAAIAARARPVHCHAERLGNSAALLASACKRLALEPAGEVTLTGPALMPVYLKGLLDKLSVQADFVHVGAYKGAAEPLTRMEPSPEMRRTYDDLVDGAYARLQDAIATGRGVPRERVVAWIDQGVFTAEAALAAGLVDEVTSFTAFRDASAPGGAWRKVRVSESKGGMEDLASLLGMRPRKRVRGPHLALLYAVGEVVEGRGGISGAFSEIASGRLAPAVRAAAANDDVKAIVLRVDSPGGSALASEVIWHAVRDAAAKKPVIVSMGGLAASGGYYISTPATRIFAQPDTLTGSIGVVGGKIVVGPALARLGVHVEEIGRGKRALIGSPVRPWSADERALVQQTMSGIYDTFKARVAEGRRMAPADVELHAQGRVFTGAQALERRLVDELGSLEDALAHARQAAGLPAAAPVDVYPGEPTLVELLGSLGGGVRARGLRAAVATFAPILEPRLAQVLDETLALLGAFERDPVRVVTFLPMLR
jgi:protease IV